MPLPAVSYADRFAATIKYRQSLRSVVHWIKSGDTLYDILLQHKVSSQEVGMLLSTYKSRPELKDLGRLREGEELELFFDRKSKRLEKVRYQDPQGHVLALGRASWGWTTSQYINPLIVMEASAWGTIENSLYESALNASIPFELAMALADIYAWDIDFFTDLRPDDHYAFLYEQKFRDGKLVDNGRINVAQFVNDGTPHQAFYFQVQGRNADYYDEHGRSLRKQFLKTPLRFTRISSGFSKRRLHPVLKIYRPHLGIDYAAPTGTPVEAVGDGRVTFRGWKSGYGRFIAIRHNGSYTTTYGHLSRYAKGVTRGSAVKQGQVIGYVGASGLATGPHLDYRMKKDGRFINPLKIQFPAALPVPPDQMAEFTRRARLLEEKLGSALAQSQPEEDGSKSLLAASGNM